MEKLEIVQVDVKRDVASDMSDRLIVQIPLQKPQFILPHTVGNKTYYTKEQVIDDLKKLQKIRSALY